MTQIAPFHPGFPLLGCVPQLIKEGGIRFSMDLWRRYGDAVRYRMGPKMTHMYVRPEHARRMLVENRSNYTKGPSYDRLRLFMGDGLLMSEGSTWRARRRHMNPYFKRSMAESWTDIMVETTSAHLDAVDTGLETDKVLSIEIPGFGARRDAGERFSEIQTLLQRISELPGVRSAGLSSDVPLRVEEGARRPMLEYTVEGIANDPSLPPPRAGSQASICASTAAS